VFLVALAQNACASLIGATDVPDPAATGADAGDDSQGGSDPVDAALPDAAETTTDFADAVAAYADAPADVGADHMVPADVAAGTAADSSSDSGAASDGAMRDAAAVCTGDLSNIGAGDFHVSLTLTSASTGTATVALANQRSACGRGMFWDLHSDHGALRAETDDAVNYTALLSTTRIDDGRPHDVLLQRRNGTLSLYVDGLIGALSASSASFGPLPRLVAGTDVCSQDIAFTGTLKNLCVASP
jgi:hypothetical protein